MLVENHVAKPNPSVDTTVWKVFCLLTNKVYLLNNANDLKSVFANLIVNRNIKISSKISRKHC